MKFLILCNDRLALPAVQELLRSNLVAAVAMTKRQSEVHSIVQMMCASHQVPFIQLDKTSFSLELRAAIMQYQPEAVLVKTFPWKIASELLRLPAKGFVNFHYAPLPEFRGANPLFWMIKEGSKEIGVTVHKMTEELDQGPIILESRMPLNKGVTFGMLISQLGYSGLELTGKLLQMFQSGDLPLKTQKEHVGKWYGRPEQKDLWIDWKAMDASQVQRLVNACNPWNKGAVAQLNNGWMIGVTQVTPIASNGQLTKPAGSIVELSDKDGLCVSCARNTLLRIEIIYSEEGFMLGKMLASFGINNNMHFT